MKQFLHKLLVILVILNLGYSIYNMRPECKKAPANQIVYENCKPGNPPEEWDVNGAGHPSILGFATDISKNKGEKIDFKIKTDSTEYKIDIYRLGHYQELGARLIDTIYPSAQLPQKQPECHFEEDTWLVDCGNWEISATWEIPKNIVSGYFIARPTRLDTPSQENWRTDKSKLLNDKLHMRANTDPFSPPKKNAHSYGALGMYELRNKLKEPYASHIYFIVRDDESKSEILLQSLDTTWQAYNGYGGYTTYGTFDYPFTHFPHSQPLNITDPNHAIKRAHKASYNRPFTVRDYRDVNVPFSHEHPWIRFLEGNGYDVTYFTAIDSARRGELIQNHKIFLSVGHDEYWSQAQRDFVTEARNKGVNLGFFAGNEVYWRIRFENSAVDNQEYRTMVVYKDTQSTERLDPVDWTGTWRDNREINTANTIPENELTGTIFTVNAHRNDPLQIPYPFNKLRLWRNTKIQDNKPGQTYTSIPGILGHEWDSDIDNGFRPEGQIRFSETIIDNVQAIQDEGSVFDSGTGYHHLVQYRSKLGGGLVFGAGCVGWSWGLDRHHDSESGVPAIRANKYNIRSGENKNGEDHVIQQATVNIFADMGVKANSLYEHLVQTDKSEDKEGPVVQISSAQLKRQNLIVQGSAQDLGNGMVAGVEVSFTVGKWHPAVLYSENSKFIFKWGDKEYHSLYDTVRKNTCSSSETEGNTCGADGKQSEIVVKVRAIDDSSNMGEIVSQIIKL